MPALPWKRFAAVEPETECTVMGSRLPLRKHRSIPGFLRWTLRIRGQLAETPGLIGYALDAKLTRKTFFTVSAWRSRADLERFVETDPHHTGIEAIRPHMAPSQFVFWTCPARELPVRFDEVRRRLDAS
ncbi:MAG: DUF3291 domain-containing protein [Acidimicrobiia bacterium]